MNRIIVTGRLVADPEARTTQTGKAQSNFRIAVNRRYKNADGKREADFLPVVAWGATADFVNKYMVKGRAVAVEGSIQTRTYDAQDGSKRHITEIIADNVEALESAKQQAEAQRESEDGFTPVDYDDLPF